MGACTIYLNLEVRIFNGGEKQHHGCGDEPIDFTGERRHVSSAYLTFVAVDRHGRKLPVAPVVPETRDEIRRYEDAGRRRDLRRAEKMRKAEVASRG